MEAKIHPKDLRIGNYVNYEQTTHIITGLLENECISEWVKAEKSEPYTHSYDDIKGIELSEDWLIRMGFVETNKVAKRFLLEISDKGFRHIQLSLAEVGNNPKWYASSEGFFLKTLYTVHDLQNLVYQLTGSELTTKDINNIEVK